MPFMQPWDRVPFRAGRPHLGSPPRSGWVQDPGGSRTGRPPGPRPRPRALPCSPSLSPPAPPRWTPLSSATWRRCCRPGCPAGGCRPTCGGCTTSAPTARTSSASTSPGMEVSGGRLRAGRWRGRGGHGNQPPPLPASLLSGGAASTPDASGPRGRGGAVPAPEPGAVRAGGAGGHGGLRLAQRHRLYPAGGTRPGPRHAVPEHGRRGGRRVTPPRAPGTDFSTLTHSRGSSASPLLVRLENGRHSHNKAVHAGCSRTFSFLGDRHLSRSCWLVGGRPRVPEPPPPPTSAWLLGCLCPDSVTASARPTKDTVPPPPRARLGPSFSDLPFLGLPRPQLASIQTVSSPWARARFPREPAHSTHSQAGGRGRRGFPVLPLGASRPWHPPGRE